MIKQVAAAYYGLDALKIGNDIEISLHCINNTMTIVDRLAPPSGAATIVVRLPSVEPRADNRDYVN